MICTLSNKANGKSRAVARKKVEEGVCVCLAIHFLRRPAMKSFIASVISIFLILSVFGNAEAQLTFSSPINISQSPGTTSALFNKVDYAVKSMGSFIYAAWAENVSPGGGIYFSRSTNEGATWSMPINVSTTPQSLTYLRMAVTGSNVYLMWSNGIVNDYFFAYSHDNGQTFSSPVNLSNGTVNNNCGACFPLPEMAANATGVYVIWTSDAYNGVIKFIRSIDGGVTFSTPAILPHVSGTIASLGIAANGQELHIVVDAVDFQLDYIRSLDGGATFEPTRNLYFHVYLFNPQIRVSGTNVYMSFNQTPPVYVGANEIAFLRSTDNGQTFSAPTVISGSLQTCSQDNPFVVDGMDIYEGWINWDQTNPDGTCARRVLAHSSNGGATWSTPIGLPSIGVAGNTGMDLVAMDSSVYVVWDGSSGPISSFLSSSDDHGATFSSPIQVTPPFADGYVPSVVLTDAKIHVIWKGGTQPDIYTSGAEIASTFTLTLDTAGTGSGTVSGAGIYTSGQTATVSAAANGGSTFDGWSGPNAGECATGSVVMTADKSCTATFTISNLPDLVMTAVTPNGSTANQGGTLPVINTVMNQGVTTSNSFRIAYHLSTDAVYGNGDDVALSTIRTVTSLGAGASNSATTSLVIPSSAPGGAYYVCALADALGQVSESNETNNTLCSAGTITLPVADLVMTAVSTTTTAVAPGQPAAVSNSVQNQGAFKAGSFTIGFYLSINADGSTQDGSIGNTRTVESLAVGATNTTSTTVTIPLNTVPGAYYLCAAADVFHQVPESNETNNVGCAPVSIVVTGQPDLLMTSLTLNATLVSAAGTLSVTDTVLNQGTAAARPFNIAYHLSVDTTYGNADDLAIVTSRTVGSLNNYLAAEASDQATTSLQIPAATPAGTYHVCALADWNGLVAESDETNNTICSAATVTVPLADLLVSALSTPATSVTAGGTMPVSLSVTNQGGVRAGTSIVAFHLSTNPVYGDEDDLPSSTSWINGSVYQGTTVYISTEMQIPVTASPGTSYYICVMADSTNAVNEGDENNNTSCTPTTITVVGP
jgi:subtilase family serine protease